MIDDMDKGSCEPFTMKLRKKDDQELKELTKLLNELNKKILELKALSEKN